MSFLELQEHHLFEACYSESDLVIPSIYLTLSLDPKVHFLPN